MELHVGCAMWSHPSWDNRRLAPRERLRAYASWCNAVEGNTTFYATPSPDTVASWVEQTAPGFRFLLKIPKAVTHERRLIDVAGPVRGFLDAIAPLGERVHALWIQLPPSFGPSDLGTLSSFLRRMPRDYRQVVEVRHPAFFEDPRPLEQALNGAEWVTFDTTVLFGQPPVTEAEQESWQKKPRLPRRSEALTAHPVVRYIGRDDPEQTAHGWQPWVNTVVGWLREGRSPTVFIHTPDNAEAPALARRFHDDVRKHLPAVKPLPEPVATEPLTLF